jgi:hypothetical protein
MFKFIRFFAEKEYLDLGKPVNLKNQVPQWYKDAELTYVDSETGEESGGLKKCVPYLDAMISGYALTTPCAIYVSEDEDGNLELNWDGPDSIQNFIMERPKESGATMPRPAGHHPNHLVWSAFWSVKTPKGYSMLMTHPQNRFDLPFTTTAGIIDSDEFTSSGNIPFFMKKGFVGTIPQGTPIAQLIPIKRAKWKSMVDPSLSSKKAIIDHIIRDPETLYKKVMWHKKEYN